MFLKPNHTGTTRGVCAAVGVAVAAGLYYGGYAPAEPTVLSGIAFAAAGAAAGLAVYGVIDVIRNLRQ